MVREENSWGYREEFDHEALRELAQMAVRDTINDEFGEFLKTEGKRIPGGDYSDFSCVVWQLMKALIRYGISLERFMQSEGVVYDTQDDAFFNLRCPPYIGKVFLERRE